MNRVYLTVCAVLSVLLLASAYGLYEAGGRIAELRQERSVLTKALNRAQERAEWDRQVLVARQAEIASSRLKLERAQRTLVGALERNKTWSDTDVPIEVQKLLSGPPDGLPEPAGGVQ